jgi:hypothetical protein
VLEHAGRDPVRHEGGKVRPHLVKFGRRAAMRRPAVPCLRPAAAGAAEAGQPERDLAEHGGDLVGAVILDLARGSAGATQRPSERMVPALDRHDFLLDQSHKLLALRQGQTQSRDVVKITGRVDHHHVDASARPIDPSLHQAQNPPHP